MLQRRRRGRFAFGASSKERLEELKETAVMINRIVSMAAAAAALCALAGAALADTESADQKEVWKIEQQQWAMDAAKDASWLDTLVHPNLRLWETGEPMPRDKASLKHWSRYGYENSTTLEQEIFPISATITGNVAVVQYHYRVARENFKKERETVTGHYTDILMKDGGKWLFIAWEGGDDPKK
jgi:Domain of unknown function (DUF4440)